MEIEKLKIQVHNVKQKKESLLSLKSGVNKRKILEISKNFVNFISEISQGVCLQLTE